MKFWTTNDLAEAADVSPQFIRQEIAAGNIECDKIGRDWAIPEEEAQRWLEERRAKEKPEREPEA
jgi:hypothetical protein